MIANGEILVDDEMKSVITKELAWHYSILPKEKLEDTLIFYVDNKDDKEKVIEDLQIIFGTDIKLIPVDSTLIEKGLSINYRKSNSKNTKTNPEDFLEYIISESIDFGSSDIHFEIYKDEARVRIRIDGILIEKNKINKEEYQEIVNRIKIQSNLDITEKRLPQDGRTRISDFDIRVSILPTLYGEKIVLRILGQDASNIDINKLGFEEIEQLHYIEAIKKSNGIVLISGPTGSGKTTTLYATLKILNETKRNIVTVEDPIEYTLEGINQVQLKEDIGLTFASALRSFLRQDPDVIMLGEIRDKETAEMAIRAALTGHLVLSTIHTNSAWGTISRLIDMGVPPFLLAETINISVAQRLVRKLCINCKKKTILNENDIPNLYKSLLRIKEHFLAVGCDKCFYTGYTGRRAIYEIIPMDEIMAENIKENKMDISSDVKENGFSKLSEKALEMLQTGETSLEEVYSILINRS